VRAGLRSFSNNEKTPFSIVKKQKAHLTGAQKREEVLASNQGH
jgi:hypothetical protein